MRRAGRSRLLILGGEGHAAGESAGSHDRFSRLAAWGQERLGVAGFTHRWATQDSSTIDRLPYIGAYHPLARHLWVATGFGLWGMTNGTLAGLLLADRITHTDNPYARLYDPTRVTISLKPARKLADIGLRTGRHYTADYLRALTGDGTDQIAPGSGAVVRVGAKPTAIYHDPEHGLKALSAVCTHLGCVVAFNDAENSWDCPCHGSRFDTDGQVIEGRATQPLTRRDRPNTTMADTIGPIRLGGSEA